MNCLNMDRLLISLSLRLLTSKLEDKLFCLVPDLHKSRMVVVVTVVVIIVVVIHLLLSLLLVMLILFL